MPIVGRVCYSMLIMMFHFKGDVMDELECELRIMKFRRLCQDTNYLWRKQAESNRPEGYEVYVPDYDDGVAMGLQIAEHDSWT